MAGSLNSNAVCSSGVSGTATSHTLQQWHQLFDASERTEQAREHMAQLTRLGLPNRRDENWKYTPLDGLFKRQFVMSPYSGISTQQCQQLALPLDAVQLVFVDGQYNQTLSDDVNGSGYQVLINQDHQSLPTAIQPEIFLHLTESLTHCVSHISVTANQQPVRPLLLLHISSGSDDEQINTSHYRHHLTLAAGAEATIIEHFVSLDERRHFTGSRLTMQIAENARLHHYKLAFENRQSYHFSHNDIRIAQDAAVHSSSFLLGSGVLRHNTSCQLNGENIDARINSMALPVGSEVCDTRTWLEHNSGHCFSRQMHKIIARDRARGVFNGLITVAPGALKTDGQMTNNNLLLDRLAEVDTRPQLEIYADDVKCSHGATVGRIDDEQLFYLCARGIPEQAAQQMIIYAFAAELTEMISIDSLKQQVLARIGHRLQREAT